MASRPPLAETCKCEMQWTATDEVGGHIAANIFYLATGSIPLTVTNLNTMASDIATAADTDLIPVLPSTWKLSSVTVTAIDGTEAQGVAVVSYVGSEGSQALPPDKSACISWPIARAYRGGHPRTYAPTVSSSQMSNIASNVMTSAGALAIAEAWASFQSAVNTVAIGGVDINMGTVSYTLNKVPRVTPVFFEYNIPKVNTRLATQRRRLGKLSVGVYELG